MKIFSDTKAFLERLLYKPAPLTRKADIIKERYLRYYENEFSFSGKNVSNKLYITFIDRLCRSLSFTCVNDTRQLVIDTRGKRFIFQKAERGYEILFFGWLYYFPWHHLFSYGKLAEDLEEKCDEIISFITKQHEDEALEIDKVLSALIQTLSISWNEDEKAFEESKIEKGYSDDIIKEKILSWGIRHIVLQPLSWFGLLGFHDLNMEVTDIVNAKYIVITPFCKKFLSEKKGIVI